MQISRRGALAGMASGFALPLLPSRAWAAGPAPLRLAAAGDDDITPILYGQHAGIFKKAGLDVTLTALSSGSATAAAVVGGSIDIGKSSLTGICAAHARGVPFEIIAPASIYLDSYPIAGFVVAKDANIASARELNGKTVSASSLKDLMAVATQAWIDANGGNSKTVKFLEVPASAVPAALEQGRVVGATLVTPALAEALDTGKVKLMGRSFSAIGKRFMVAGWFATRDWLGANQDTAKRFVDAFLQAAAYTDTHHAETVELLAAYSKLKSETIKSMVRATAGKVVDPKDIEPVIAAAVKYGIFDKPFPAAELIAPVAPR
jgi:NitT/TauT family transport system substrate-binding protein